jgi:hypothetical protein
MRRLRVAAAALLLVAAACDGAVQDAGPSGSPGETAAPPADASLLRYTCDGRFAFGADLLERPGGDELAATPAAAALRAHLAKPDMDIDWLPDTGWTLLGEDEQGAEYVAPGGESGLIAVSVENVDGAWRVGGWGGCTPMRVLAPGIGEATWVLDDAASIGPGTTEFTALVTERDCASGQPSVGRVLGPDIMMLEEQVLVTFAVRPLPGGHDCQGNPSTPVRVVLPEPIGDRRLLDGSTLPPREPAAEP